MMGYTYKALIQPKKILFLGTQEQLKYRNGGCSGFEPDFLLHLLSEQLFKPYLYLDSIFKRISQFLSKCKKNQTITSSPAPKDGCSH